MEQKKSVFGEFDSEEEFLNCITDVYGIYEGEGLEEVYFTFMKLPLEKRTTRALEDICFDVSEADIDECDLPPYLHYV